MRFVANGPAIPDSLLLARDRNEVVFFCGAGVSQARARLSNFTQLAKKVLARLGPEGDSPARQLLDRATLPSPIQGIGSYVATDRIFSLLEREFDTDDIHSAVAAALKPEVGADRSAHELILDLAGRKSGAVRLVTTNFDRLFEDCDNRIASIGPAHIPDPKRTDINAIIHLHGRVDVDYNGSDDEGFVLSSGDFGRAYLADRWASRFIQSLLSRYSIVFLGYSADDPPVQYLLEALKGTPAASGKMYAFQSGDGSVATSLWENKGVHAMAFDPKDDYKALWTTLEAWVQRVNDVDGWHEAILAKAAVGPARLQPHERGQVCHVLATVEGVRRVIQLPGAGLPGTWLQVVDPRERYKTPGENADCAAGNFDPFDHYGLDDDVPPPPPNPKEDAISYVARPREIPKKSWDGFAIQPLDFLHQTKLRDIFHSDLAATASPLPERIRLLAVWLSRVAHQPDTFSWALEQRDLHPQAKELIASALNHEAHRFPEEIARGWRYLLRSWADRRAPADQAAFAVSTEAQRSGWTDDLVRKLIDTRRPKLDIQRSRRTKMSFEEGVPFDIRVDYPRPHIDVEIPESMLKVAVYKTRETLELARSLEAEIRQIEWIYLPSTYESSNQILDIHGHGMVGLVLEMQRLTARLAIHDAAAAHTEFMRWSKEDDGIFARLRIWAASQPKITTALEAANVVLELSDRAFWGTLHQRDLLLTLRSRWNEIPPALQKKIERKLISTRFPWENKSNADHYSDLALFERLKWLEAHGLRFVSDFGSKIADLTRRLGKDIPEIEDAVADNQPRVHSIYTNTDPTDLVSLPLREVLTSADAAEGIDYRKHVQREPFSGLVDQHPFKALASLSYEFRQGRTHLLGWTRFLQSEIRKNDSTRMLRLICGRLAAFETQDLDQLIHPAAHWMQLLASRLQNELPDLFSALWSKMLATVREFYTADNDRYSERNWADDGLNGPVGKLAQILLQDPRIAGKRRRRSGLDLSWKTEMEELLALPGDLRGQALVFMAFHFSVFWYIDPEWTSTTLMPEMVSKDLGGDAFWDGFLWANKVPHPQLLAKMVDPMLLRVAEGSRRKPITDSLADILLYSWVEWSHRKRPPVTGAKFRTAIVLGGTPFAVQVLWNLGRRFQDGTISPDKTIEFFRTVWPLQKSLKSQDVSNALSTFLFKTGDFFPEIAPLVLSRLVPSDTFDIYPLYLSKGVGIVEQHPEMLLQVFHRLLPADVGRWSHHMGEILDRLAGLEKISGDERLAHLRRSIGRPVLASSGGF